MDTQRPPEVFLERCQGCDQVFEISGPRYGAQLRNYCDPCRLIRKAASARRGRIHEETAGQSSFFG